MTCPSFANHIRGPYRCETDFAYRLEVLWWYFASTVRSCLVLTYVDRVPSPYIHVKSTSFSKRLAALFCPVDVPIHVSLLIRHDQSLQSPCPSTPDLRSAYSSNRNSASPSIHAIAPSDGGNGGSLCNLGVYARLLRIL